MAGPYHGQHDGSRNEARSLLRERLQREDREKNRWSPQSPFRMTVVAFAFIAVAMLAVAWLG